MSTNLQNKPFLEKNKKKQEEYKINKEIVFNFFLNLL